MATVVAAATSCAAGGQEHAAAPSAVPRTARARRWFSLWRASGGLDELRLHGLMVLSFWGLYAVVGAVLAPTGLLAAETARWAPGTAQRLGQAMWPVLPALCLGGRFG